MVGKRPDQCKRLGNHTHTVSNSLLIPSGVFLIGDTEKINVSKKQKHCFKNDLTPDLSAVKKKTVLQIIFSIRRKVLCKLDKRNKMMGFFISIESQSRKRGSKSTVTAVFNHLHMDK